MLPNLIASKLPNSIVAAKVINLFLWYAALVTLTILIGLPSLPGLGEAMVVVIYILLGVSVHKNKEQYGKWPMVAIWAFGFWIFLLLVLRGAMIDLLNIYILLSLYAAVLLLSWIMFYIYWEKRTAELPTDRSYVIFLTIQGVLLTAIVFGVFVFQSLV